LAFIGVDILSYLLDHKAVVEIGSTLQIPLRGHKTAALFDIVNIMWNVWHLGRRKKFTRSLVVAQRMWRTKKHLALQRCSGPWPEKAAINDTDPFTMEPVANLPRTSIFSFQEIDNVYAFSGMEFFTYVYEHHCITNPLTRRLLDTDVLDRLYTWSKHIKSICANYEVSPVLDTPTTTITYAVSELERLHYICIQPSWLLRLDEMEIMGIFSAYHRNMMVYGPNVPYMDRLAEENSFEADNPGPSQIALGREMITMIHTEQATSFYVCNLVLILATYIPDLQASLPDWVHDAAEV
jgi:hypothetical protein